MKQVNCSAEDLKEYFKVTNERDYAEKIKKVRKMDGELAFCNCDCNATTS